MNEKLLKPDTQRVSDAREFLQQFSSVIMASIADDGLPHISYAPYIVKQDRFYVYVSGLARHSVSLKNGYSSLLWIENEQQARNLFARKRLTMQCQVTEILKKRPNYQLLLDLLEQQHGSTVTLLRTLPDFILFELTPQTASFVTGFGAAFDLSPYLDQLGKTRSQD